MRPGAGSLRRFACTGLFARLGACATRAQPRSTPGRERRPSSAAARSSACVLRSRPLIPTAIRPWAPSAPSWSSSTCSAAPRAATRRACWWRPPASSMGCATAAMPWRRGSPAKPNMGCATEALRVLPSVLVASALLRSWWIGARGGAHGTAAVTAWVLCNSRTLAASPSRAPVHVATPARKQQTHTPAAQLPPTYTRGLRRLPPPPLAAQGGTGRNGRPQNLFSYRIRIVNQRCAASRVRSGTHTPRPAPNRASPRCRRRSGDLAPRPAPMRPRRQCLEELCGWVFDTPRVGGWGFDTPRAAARCRRDSPIQVMGREWTIKAGRRCADTPPPSTLYSKTFPTRPALAHPTWLGASLAERTRSRGDERPPAPVPSHVFAPSRHEPSCPPLPAGRRTTGALLRRTCHSCRATPSWVRDCYSSMIGSCAAIDAGLLTRLCNDRN